MKISTVTATEANRSFSRLLEAVKRGERVEITSHGRKVAVVQPVEDEPSVRKRQLALLDKLEKRKAAREFVVVGPWTREELYERD